MPRFSVGVTLEKNKGNKKEKAVTLEFQGAINKVEIKNKNS